MAIGVALGSWGAYLAEKKNRSRQLGFLLGFFFGIIVILILILLIEKKPKS
jgi:tetrahydromethanopterin S-methyltransferase subunit G